MEHTSGFGVYFMFPGGTTEQYDSVLDALDLMGKPDGSICHVAWADDHGLNVSEVWESKEAWETFKKDHLDMAMEGKDLPKGNVMTFEVHNVMC